MQHDTAFVRRVAGAGHQVAGHKLAQLDAGVVELAAQAGSQFSDGDPGMAFNDPEDFDHAVGQRPDPRVLI